MTIRKQAKMTQYDRRLMAVSRGIEVLSQALLTIRSGRTDGTIYVIDEMEEDCRTLEAKIKDLRASCSETQ